MFLQRLPAQQAAEQVEPLAYMQGDLSAIRQRMMFLQRRARNPCPSGLTFVAEARPAGSRAARAGGLLKVQHQSGRQGVGEGTVSRLSLSVPHATADAAWCRRTPTGTRATYTICIYAACAVILHVSAHQAKHMEQASTAFT
jgi:hypothetical protein